MASKAKLTEAFEKGRAKSKYSASFTRWRRGLQKMVFRRFPWPLIPPTSDDFTDFVGQSDSEGCPGTKPGECRQRSISISGKSIRPKLPRSQRQCDFLSSPAWRTVKGAKQAKRSLDGRRCKVDTGARCCPSGSCAGLPAQPPQNRTCPIKAYGS